MEQPTHPQPALLAVRRLTKTYGGRPVLRDLGFDLARGECLVILGRSGSGKSVLLRQLNGLERPDGGSVCFDGTISPRWRNGSCSRRAGASACCFRTVRCSTR
jgi:ABC-type Fe3+/spermidine/putrescine transport system ATPase subunit